MTSQEKYEIERRIAELPLVEQLQFVEALIRNLRRSQTDETETDRLMDEMVTDADMLRILNNQDLGPKHAMG